MRILPKFYIVVIVLLWGRPAYVQEVSLQQALADEISELALYNLGIEHDDSLLMPPTTYVRGDLVLDGCRGLVRSFKWSRSYGQYLSEKAGFDLYKVTLEKDNLTSKYYDYYPIVNGWTDPAQIDESQNMGVLRFIFSAPNAVFFEERPINIFSTPGVDTDPNEIPFEEVAVYGFEYQMAGQENEDQISLLADKILEYQQTYCSPLA